LIQKDKRDPTAATNHTTILARIMSIRTAQASSAQNHPFKSPQCRRQHSRSPTHWDSSSPSVSPGRKHSPAANDTVPPRRRRSINLGCFTCIAPVLGLILVLFAVYLLFPLRTNILIMGIDRVPDGTALGRTDTIIMMSVIPLKPEVNMLSNPA
jgi:hypothetical protein